MPCRMKRSNAPEPDFSPRIKHDAERRGEGLRIWAFDFGKLVEGQILWSWSSWPYFAWGCFAKIRGERQKVQSVTVQVQAGS